MTDCDFEGENATNSLSQKAKIEKMKNCFTAITAVDGTMSFADHQGGRPPIIMPFNGLAACGAHVQFKMTLFEVCVIIRDLL